MPRLLLSIAALSFVLACGPLSLGVRPLGEIAVPASASGTAPVSPPATESLTQIPLYVGRGVRGPWFELYFTDPANPVSTQFNGGVDDRLVDAINQARLSVHVAMYSMSLRDVGQALIQAHRRGIDVRMVMESDNMGAEVPQALQQAGIPILGDRRQGTMHDKFTVIDGDEVWTGSMNFTSSGAYSDNNNMIRIFSSKVAADYETEFQEMFVKDRFGPDAGDPTPNPQVTIDGIPLEVYFSPDDHVRSALLQLLDRASTSIYFLAYSFTSDELGKAVLRAQKAGLKVSGVMDTNQGTSDLGTELDAFRQAGLDVRLDGNPGQMHDKVFIIDGKVVALGSYNFTGNAEKLNDENLIVIHSPAIAQEYLEEYQRIYALGQP
jgi:phosphatidylserine/phosphatidylglycerophosphate/cardiolipin synthase-like enzyme